MFITRSAYKSPLSAMFAASGEEMWEAAELPMQQIWFVVNLEIKEDEAEEFSSASTLLVTDFKSVEPLLQPGQGGNTRLSSVQIVTPGNQNGSLNWKMESLSAVLEGRETIEGQELPVYIFETASGNRYPGSFCNLSVEELGGGTPVFQLPIKRNT